MSEGGSRNDPQRIRCGCFLPDLTGLAKTASARLPDAHMAIWPGFCNGFASEALASATMFQIGFLEETLLGIIRNNGA